MKRTAMPTCVVDAQAITAENPIWDDRRGVFYWTDIPARRIHCFDPATLTNRTWHAPEQIGAIALTEAGDWILLAGERAFWAFHLAQGRYTRLLEVPLSDAELRFNDGRADGAGAFWVGSLVARDWPAPDAGLFRLGPDWSFSRTDRKVFTSNGLAVSPDGRWLYHADSRRRTVWRQHIDTGAGHLCEAEVFFDFARYDGVPDGAAVDGEGGYWIAMYGGWRVCRLLNQRIETEIPLPVASPTMCAFGGKDRRSLIITSSSRFLSPEDKARQPLAGAVFQIPMTVAGLRERRFAGDLKSLKAP